MAVGGEIEIAAGVQTGANKPDVTGLSGGGSMVVWSAVGASGDEIFARVLDAAGTPAGAAFQVNIATSSTQALPDIVELANGNLVVAYESNAGGAGGDGSGHAAVARILNASGAPLSGEIILNSFTTSAQRAVAVAPNGPGGFVATWQSINQDGSGNGIYASRFDSTGGLVGVEFLVNTTTAQDQFDPAIATLVDGGFVISWTDDTVDGSSTTVMAQRYDVNGAPVGGEFRVNDAANSDQAGSNVLALADGGFVISFFSQAGVDGSSYAVIGQRYDVNGARIDGNFVINEAGEAAQDAHDLTLLGDGRMAAVWDSASLGASGDGSGQAVLTRLFGDPLTAMQSADPVVNNVPSTITLDEAAVNAGDVPLFAPDVSDLDSANYDGGALQVRLQRAGLASDLFNAPDNEAQVDLTLTSPRVLITNGTEVRLDGTIVGTLVSAGQAGTDLVVDLNANADDEAVEELLAALAYRNTSDDPDDSLTFTLRLSDGDGGATDPIAFGVAVTPAPEADGAFEGYQPLDGELQVNLVSANAQQNSAIAAFPFGTFVVVWESFDQDDVGQSNYGIFGQLYRAEGHPVGPQFLVNSTQSGNQRNPDVQVLSNGQFVVTWDGNGPGDTQGVMMQRFSNSGEKLGNEIALNASASGTEANVRIADGNSRFLAVWEDTNGDGSGYGIRAALYGDGGTVLLADTQINSFTNGTQRGPAAAGLTGGNFVVVWESLNQDVLNQYQINMQMLDSSGAPVLGETRVSNFDFSGARHPVVTGLNDGSFVVAWIESNAMDGDGAGIFAQRFDATGTAVGDTFLVNEGIAASQEHATISALSHGGFVIGWESANGEDGDGYTVLAQQYDANGNRIDGAMIVNEAVNSTQDQLDIAGRSNGGFAATWTSAFAPPAGDGDGTGVFARVFGSAAEIANLSPQPVIEGLSPVLSVQENLANLALQRLDLDAAVAIGNFTEVSPGGASRIRVDVLSDLSAVAGQVPGRDGTAQHQIGFIGGDGITVQPNTALLVDGYVVGAVTSDGQNGAPLEVFLNGLADARTVERLIENIGYANTSVAPVDKISLAVQVGDSRGLSEPSLVEVNITSTPDGYRAAGLEDQANTFVLSTQFEPHVTAYAGGFVMVWSSYNQDPGAFDFGVFGQRFDAVGVKVGREFQINTTTAGSQKMPRVAGTDTGGFTVVWEDENGTDTSGSGVFVQSYDANGVAIGSETQVNSFVTGQQFQPDITVLENGDLVAIYTSFGNTTVTGSSGFDIWGQVLASGTGLKIGSEFRVNTQTGSTQDTPGVDATDDGGFVVTWTSVTSGSAGDGSGDAVLMRRYDVPANNYAPIGNEVIVNSTRVNAQFDPDVAVLDDGSFVVVWTGGDGQDGSGSGVFAQKYASDGTAIGQEFRVNDVVQSSQDDPAIAALSTGGFVVVYTDSSGADGNGQGVFAQEYDAQANRVDGPEIVNTLAQGTQNEATVSALGGGGYVVGWVSSSDGSSGDGSGDGVFFKVFGNTAPVVGAASATGQEDVPFQLAFDMFEAAFTDTDGHTLKGVRLDSLPGNGTLRLEGVVLASGAEVTAEDLVAGRLTYHGTLDFNTVVNGPDAFSRSGFDGIDYSITPASFDLTIAPVNDAPYALDATYVTDEDVPATVAVLVNAGDIDGDGLSLDAVGPASNGTTQIVAGQVLYTPDLNFNGTDSFTYSVGDGSGLTDTATVTMTVNPVSDAPLAVDDGFQVLAETRLGDLALHPLDNDSDPDGDPLTILSFSAPANGVTSASSINPAIYYAPDIGFTGTDTFTYIIQDTSGATDTATVTVTVNATGNETLTGTALADTLQGRDGDDVLNGLGGMDILYGGSGDDTSNGGPGFDTLAFANKTSGVGVDLNTNLVQSGGTRVGASYVGTTQTDTAQGFENLLGTDYDDLLIGKTGSAGNIRGNDGDDRIVSSIRNDSVDGGEGSDTVITGAGTDLIFDSDASSSGALGDDMFSGGPGFDTLDHSGMTAGVDVNLQLNQSLAGGGFVVGTYLGAAQTNALFGIENVVGSGFDDRIQAKTGSAAILDGGAGNDTLIGGNQNDRLSGDAGNDSSVGGCGQRYDLRQRRQ